MLRPTTSLLTAGPCPKQSTSWLRRKLKLLSFILLGFVFLVLAPTVRADEFDDLRLKWRNSLVGTGYDTSDANVISRLNSIANSANANWASLDKFPARTFLWSDLASTTVSIHINYNYQRLRSMALAYATPGCSLYGNPALLADTIGGLDWMHAKRYNPTVSIYDNWYEFEIGSPIQLVDIAVLLYDQLTPAQISNYMGAVEKFTPSATTQAPGGTSGSFTGSNRMLKIRIVAVRGCVVKDPVKLAAARDAFSNLFVYVTSGDGFYTDGSFIQHTNHPYTAAYGSGLLASMAPVLNWLSGSTWAVVDPLKRNLFSWVFDSYEPIIYKGAALDLVRGREAGRAGDPQGVGHTIMDSILQIAQFAPPDDSLRMRQMVKEWALSDTVRDFVSGRPLSTLTYAQNLISDPETVRRGELIDHYSFPEMDRVVHLGKDYCFGLSMCSTRIANFESINGNNLRGWFTGDGMTTLYNADLNQFGDDTNCTIDAYRMPGVTADVEHVKLPNVPASIGPRAQWESTLSPHSWVGGAKLGAYGAAGMQFKGVGVTLTGKKSWFMFDDEIVCLGAGITSTDTRPIETTVENRKINGGNVLTVNGTAKPTALGWSETMALTSWAHLQGNVSGSDIGYFFPTAPTIRATREARSASPSEIDVGASTTLQTRNFLRLGFEHGTNPANTTYQYVLLPGRSATRTGQYAAAPQVTILNNNANVQAVRENTLGITAINFWTDSVHTYGGVTSNKKASVLVRDDGTFIDVSVCDPTQLNTGSIALQIALDGGTLVSADAGITVTQTSPTISLSVATANAAGKTFKARFYKLAPEIVNLTPVADSYVHDATASVNSNFGTQTTMIVKKAGSTFNRESFLRFDLPAPSGVLLGGTLSLSCITANVPGVNAVAKVDDTAWSETGITWNNRPASGSVLETWIPAAATTVTANVTSALPASGPVSFKVFATTETSNGIISYGTREHATAASRPQLTLVYGRMPPQVSLTSPADGAVILKAGPLTLTAEATSTDGAIAGVAFYSGTTLLGADATAPYSIAPSLPGGPHYITAVATAANGLSRTSLATRVDVAHPPVTGTAALTTPRNTAVNVDLRSLVSDVETPLTDLKLELGPATNGTVALLADGRTARFTPASGYFGPASFSYTVTDTTRDERTVLNYAFQTGDVTDRSGQGRDATLNVQGTGAATFPTDSPLADYTKSIVLTENGTAGAVRLDRQLATTEVDFAAGDWTITGWFKRGTSSNIDVIMQLGDSGGFGPAALNLAFYGSGPTMQLRNFTSANVQDLDLSKASVAANTWHHFAVVRSGTVISLYHNGGLVGSDNAFALGFNNNAQLKFGGPNSTAALDRWLKGSLADLAVFNAPLSLAEIGKLVARPVQWFGGQSATATITVQVLSPLEQWREQHFGTAANTGDAADLADPDADGIPNLLEFACGSLPKVNNPSALSLTPGAGTLDLVYTKNKTATNLTYRVEWSATLADDWSTAGVGAPTVLSDTGSTQQIKVSIPFTPELGRRFVRLKVSSP
jgi:hyaluronate lyase